MSLLDRVSPDYEELRQWGVDHEPNDKMRYKKGYWEQILFLRDTLFTCMFWKLAEHSELCKISVIGTHFSKSIELPVVKIEYRSGGLETISLEVILSYNFHMWSVTVRSNYPVSDIVKSLRLFDTSKPHYCCLYGFDSTDVLGCYDSNQREFSCTINDYNAMWTFMRTIVCTIENLVS